MCPETSGVYLKLAYHPVTCNMMDLYELVLDVVVSLKFKLSKKKKVIPKYVKVL